MNRLIKNIKHPIIYGSLIIVVFIAVGSFYYYESNQVKLNYNYFEVKTGTIIAEVDSIGSVKAADSVDLAFDRSGRVSRVGPGVGEKVQIGQVIVQLDNADLWAQYDQAQANLKTQQAKLDDLKNGTRPEDIQVTQAQLNLNQQDLQSTYAGVPDLLNDSYNKADDAIRKQLDMMFSTDETNPQLTFMVSDSQLKNDIQAGRMQMSSMLNSWKSDLTQINISSNDTLDKAILDADANLSAVQNFLKKMSDAVIAQASLQQPTIDAYKINILAGNGEVTAGLTALDGLKQTLAAKKLVIEQTQKQLQLKQAGVTEDTITGQEAQVEGAAAAIKGIQAQISKTLITSPFYGIVAKNDAKIGQVVSPGVPLVSLISNKKFQIETYIPEADMAKIQIGNIADVTLDAYGGDVHFQAKVISVEPAATVINGISSYKTKLEFVNEDDRIKSGLTANVSITTGEKDNALMIPKSAIIRRNEDQIVLVETDSGSQIEKKIQIGITGKDGMVEILSGLNVGDKVVNFGSSQ